MPTQVQVRRGTTDEHSSFTGAVGELTVDTDKDVVVVHDGSTAGGRPMLRQDQSNLPTSAPSNGLYIPSSNNVAISTNGTGRLFVDSSGKVGVGTTPATWLDVNAGTDNTAASFTSTDAGAYISLNDPTGQGVLGQNGADLVISCDPGASTASSAIVFQVDGNSEKARIDSSGRLGLGSSSPSYKLTVSNTGGSNAGITLLGNDQANARIRIDNGGSGGRNWELTAGLTGANNSYFSIYDQTASASRFVISDTGAVGIGVTAPEQLLHLGGNNGIRFGNASSSAKADINYTSVGDEFLDIKIQGTTSGYGNIRFSTGGTPSERARIDSSGRLLVGTSTDPTGGDTNAKIAAISGGPGGLYIGRSDGDTSADRNLGQVVFRSYAGSAWESAASIQCFSDNTSGSGDKPGRLVFSTTADGASSPTERFRINNAGSFSAVIPSGSTLYPSFWCRAWVNFNGTGTVSIRGSGNVSSIADLGVGRYTINLTTAMPDINYAVEVTVKPDTDRLAGAGEYYDQTRSTSAYGISTGDATNYYDASFVSSSLFR